MPFQPLQIALSAERLEQEREFGEPGGNRVSCSSPEELLTALADADSRAIIAATADQPLSVSEIVDRCDIPTPTAYRKVSRLTEIGVLDRKVRIRSNGTNFNEFVLRVDTVHIALGNGGAPKVTFVSDAGEVPDKPPVTDPPEPDTTDPQRLGELFEEVTGTAELVDRQDTSQSRHR